MGQYRGKTLCLVAALTVLPGCLLKSEDGGGNAVTRLLPWNTGTEPTAVAPTRPEARPFDAALADVSEAEGSTTATDPAFSVGTAFNFGRVVVLGLYDVTHDAFEFGLAFNLRGLRARDH